MTHNQSQSHRSAARPAGSAMSEFVLVLPLLLVMFALLIYFGRGMIRVQHALVMDRYESWRQVAYAPGPAADNVQGNRLMNQTFFNERAEKIHYEGTSVFPSDASDQFLDATFARSLLTGELTQRKISYSSHGRTVTFKTTHAEGNAFYQQFQGPVRNTHTRFGDDWRYANAWRQMPDGDSATEVWPMHANWYPATPGTHIWRPIRETFFEEYDQALQSWTGGDYLSARRDSSVARGARIANMIRGFYTWNEGYVGPDTNRLFSFGQLTTSP